MSEQTPEDPPVSTLLPATITVTRSTTFPLVAPDAAVWKATIKSINVYRAALRHSYGTLALAHDAGSSVDESGDDIKVKLDNYKVKVIAGLATGQATVVKKPKELGKAVYGAGQTYTVKVGIGDVYSLRAELKRLLPTASGFVIDSARSDIHDAWKAPDPRFTNAQRGWLTAQGKRALARFMHRGIGMPVSTAKPQFDGRTFAVKWDNDLGLVTFKLGDLDPGRWHVWRSLADGDDGWKPGTCYLTHHDGKLKVVVSYKRPSTLADVLPDRKMFVKVHSNDDTLMTLSGPDGVNTFDRIESADVKGFLTYHASRRTALEARRAACGNPRRPWGHRKGWLAVKDVLSGSTRQRENGVVDRNHAWTRRIVTRAKSWRCGVIEVQTLPEDINGTAWNWSGFKQNLNYKAAECGVQVVWA